MQRRQQSTGHYAGSSSRDILNIDCVTQFNIIVDVLGGYSRDVRKALKELVGDKSDTIALQIQKSVITSSLNNGRRFKLLKQWTLGILLLLFLSVSIVMNRSFSI